jgi:hypothetical protein
MKNARLVAIAATIALAIGAVAAADPIDLLSPGSRAAPGLGGDPFASPLRGAPSWWTVDAPAAGRSLGASYQSSQPLPSGSFTLERSAWRAFGSAEGTVLGRRLMVSAVREDPRWSGNVAGASTRTDGVVERGGFGIGARVDDVVPGLALAATAPVQSNGAGGTTPLGVGARLDVAGVVATQISWSRARTEPQLTVAALDQWLAAGADLEHASLAADIEARIGSSISAELGLRREWLSPASGSFPSGFALAAEGTARQWQSGVVIRPSAGLRLLLRRTEGSGEGSGTAAKDGLRFGRVNYLRGRLDSWLGGADWTRGARRGLAEIEHFQIEGGGRGSVESWPFTSTLVDLLAARRNFLAEAEIDGWRAHAGAEFGRANGSRWRVGLGAYDLVTRASLIGWQPSFLVFGVSDRTEDVLGIHRVQLASVSAGATLRMMRCELAADVQQFVFAKTFGQPVEAGPAQAPATPGDPGGAEPAAMSSAHGTRWPGGTWLALAIRSTW